MFLKIRMIFFMQFSRELTNKWLHLVFPFLNPCLNKFTFQNGEIQSVWHNSDDITLLKMWSADLKMKQNNTFKYLIWITGIWKPFWRILARKWIGLSPNQPEAICSENTVERLGRKWGIFFIWAFFLSRWRIKIQVSQHRRVHSCSSMTLPSNCINAICMLFLCYVEVGLRVICFVENA